MDIAFWILAVTSVMTALAAVTLKNIFRAALFLVLCFFLVAGLFITLSADFVAAVQVLIYIGAISVLIILAIMLTREIERGSLFNKLRIPALVLSVALAGTLIFGLISTVWPKSSEPPAATTATSIASSLFSQNGYLLPVEMAAVMVLTAILGAIMLVREK